ncbi:hypothetical protein G7068_03280 [Leucobacter viscericola]|uniref:Phage tail protein n=1 Tax=Leucobacter viscericola TaxID=2714935 RepID=A0A6G7XD55_9MICO|nr:hypothetical protein [Leucobacter viscericola]QIK62337.1 hypothetical protein G7068_03280 [Leucobacter viscericola]
MTDRTDLNSGSLTYEGVRFPFGEGTPFALTDFKRGTAGIRANDAARPGRDGTALGVSYKDGPKHELSIAVIGRGDTRTEQEADTRALLQDLAGVWSADTLRSRSGGLAALTIGTLTAYGHPREFAPDDSALWSGLAEPTLTFQAVDDLWYGPEQVSRVHLITGSTGGLPIPADVPFVLDGGDGVSDHVVTVDGSAPAWPVFNVRGPIQDPFIEVVGVGRLNFRGQLAYDQTLTVDTRPWARWILRDGNPFPGALSPSGARLSDMSLNPGQHRVFFGGYDPTNTAVLEVRIQAAYRSL